MSDFKAKMHQNPKFGWGSALDPAGGAYSGGAPPDLLAGFKGAYFYGKGTGQEGREGDGIGGKGRRVMWNPEKSLKYTPVYSVINSAYSAECNTKMVLNRKRLRQAHCVYFTSSHINSQ